MKNIKKILSVVLVLFLAGCSRVQPVLNIEDTPVAYQLQKQEVQQAIVDAATERGWTVTKVEADEISAKIFVRTHTASIRIPYSEKYFSILYVSSNNLKATPDGKIHRNYNKWVTILNRDIERKLSEVATK